MDAEPNASSYPDESCMRQEIPPDEEPSFEDDTRLVQVLDAPTSGRKLFTLLVIVYINLLNYMDRYTISSVLLNVKDWFDINDSEAGLLQTSFVCSYMLFAPLFGFLGDRFSRKIVMAFGITVWSTTTFIGSLMGKNHFYYFLALRGLVGIGEASYSTIAPTILADLFMGDKRTKALTLFYFAIPCGSGLGYIAGAKIATLMNGEWQWALRITPVLGVIAVLLTLVIHDPKRGATESVISESEVDDISNSLVFEESQSYLMDLKTILKVPSFIWSTLGFTCVSFAVGALAFWAPTFILYAEQVHDKNSTRTLADVSSIFGMVAFASGILGVGLGAEWARRWRVTEPKADALVCSFGILFSIPFLFFALWLANKFIILAWVLVFIGETVIGFNWAPNGDILLYVIPANCRSTAEAIQILIMHLFGDAFSPLLTGIISDTYINNRDGVYVKYIGLLYSLFVTLFICCLGSICYMVNALYLVEDKDKVDAILRNKIETNSKREVDSTGTDPHGLLI